MQGYNARGKELWEAVSNSSPWVLLDGKMAKVKCGAEPYSSSGWYAKWLLLPGRRAYDRIKPRAWGERSGMRPKCHFPAMRVW